MENEKYILEAKKRIQNDLKKDHLVIFFTRVIEDLKTKKNPKFLGRIKDLLVLIDPYKGNENPIEAFEEFKKHGLISEYGINLDEQEKGFINIFRENLKGDGSLKNPQVMKGRIGGILNKLIEKYLPESSKVIEPYILGKLISFFGGIKNLYDKPSSTIQTIGAERALFRHKGEGKKCPKYGIIYHSKQVQKEKKKGKKARQLSNKLIRSIRVDYFRNLNG